MTYKKILVIFLTVSGIFPLPKRMQTFVRGNGEES
jgi:hypothetical protein